MKTQWIPFSVQTELLLCNTELTLADASINSLLVSKWRPLIWQVATSTTGTPYWVESSTHQPDTWQQVRHVDVVKKSSLRFREDCQNREESGFESLWTWWTWFLGCCSECFPNCCRSTGIFTTTISRVYSKSQNEKISHELCQMCGAKGLVDDRRSLSFFLGTLKSLLLPTLRQTPG